MLKIDALSAGYDTANGYISALSEVTLEVGDNEIVGIAGESGSGKSTLLKVLYGAVARPMLISNGHYTFSLPNGTSKTVSPETRADMREWWWRHISYIPQGSMNVLNPVAKVRSQFLDTFSRITPDPKRQTEERVTAYLRQLGLSPEILAYYPHQLSGGMRQRVVIALATLLQPEVILADEPTTALDVVVQKGILTLLWRLQRQMQNSLIIVSHDLGVHYQVADRIAIMYAGRVVEWSPRAELFNHPLHPYTEALIQSLPKIGDRSPRQGLTENTSTPPASISGCPFYGRCASRMEKCLTLAPKSQEVEPGRFVECHLFDN